MSRIYNSTNRIKFTDISEKYKVPKSIKGKLSQLHAVLIEYVISHFRDTKKYKQKVVDVLNIITYHLYSSEQLPFDWSISSPFTNVPDIDVEMLEDILGDILLTVEGIEWDITPTDFSSDDSSNVIEKSKSTVKSSVSTKPETVKTSMNISSSSTKKSIEPLPSILATPKQDLYIQPPSIPQFDYSKPWMKGVDGADALVIYTTLPEIPTKQNEISVTTDVTKMTNKELMELFPNCIIHTRAAAMYEDCKNIDIDPDVGLIIPVEGFTQEQVLDNIIKYPHIFKLSRMIDDKIVSFYSHIEIDGELHPTLDIWNDLPESKIIPRQSEFVKEYVVRRYLLERDIKKVKHNYPIFGTLEPFLTLFMTPTDYINRGYKDIEQIVKQCVLSRVSYKQSRNPVIRRLTQDAKLHI